MAWVRELTPLDVRDFRFPHDPDGNIYLEIVEANNRKLNARSASDGTLRFLAMLAVLINGAQTNYISLRRSTTVYIPRDCRCWLN